MRKYFFLCITLCLLFSCGDGDLEIETIDFDSVTLQFCTTPSATEKNILFKINNTEALILELQSGVLNKGVVGETVVTQSAISNQSQLTYRIFSDDVAKNYFCDDIPPVEPVVIDEVEAEDGFVTISTTADEANGNFVHTITLNEISFITESGERITNLSVSTFGEVTTAIPAP
ncbi:hypothetical protein [Flagellimonas beolgyonensis]|uniref:hypothetical protein n=1 Tax=Flagellimonas beolgyonensis TaxID=864064 RepID=UPI003D651936